MNLMIKTGRRYRAAAKHEILEAASRLHVRETLGTYMTNPETAKQMFVNMLHGREHEVFVAAFVDNRHRLIACEEMFRGTIDGASVHVREVVKHAFTHNAAAVLFAHNHPSGITEPSQADQLITARLTEGLALIEVRVLDHIIVGHERTFSFAESGLI